MKITANEAFFTAQTYRKLKEGSLQLFVATKRKTGEVTEMDFIFRPQEKTDVK